MFGIRSIRQTIRKIDVNAAYRWFIGYGLMEPVLHFTTFGKNYKQIFKGTDIFERMFYRILDEAQKTGFVDTDAIFIDETHIKANANCNKKERVKVDQTIENYQQELEKEIDDDREKHGKKPLNHHREKASVKIRQILKVDCL